MSATIPYVLAVLAAHIMAEQMEAKIASIKPSVRVWRQNAKNQTHKPIIPNTTQAP